MSSEESKLVEFALEFDGSEEQRLLAPPQARMYLKNLPGQTEESKFYIMSEKMEPTELTTYIDLMIINLKRLKAQSKKRLSAYRRMLR